MGPRRALTGEALPSIFPAVAQARADGSISAAHAGVITDCVAALAPVLDPGVSEIVEHTLVGAARHEHPSLLRRTAAQLTALLDPDERSAGQRRHDALLDAGLRLLRSDTLPDHGGVPVTILARTTLTDLDTMARARGAADTGAGSGDAGASGVAVTEHDDLISLRALLRLGCEADIVTVLLDDLGAILAYGTTRRLATAGQRRALAVRDGGCSFPGVRREALVDRVEVRDLRRSSVAAAL